jgi:hypothetical protein
MTTDKDFEAQWVKDLPYHVNKLIIYLANPNDHLKNQTPQHSNHLSNPFPIRRTLYDITVQILFQLAIFPDEDEFRPESLCADDCCAGMYSWHSRAEYI